MPAYEDKIKGDYWTLYFDEFPLAQIMSPLSGWQVRRQAIVANRNTKLGSRS